MTSPHEQLPTLRLPPVEARAIRRAVEEAEEEDVLPVHSAEIILDPQDVESVGEAEVATKTRPTDAREQLPTLRLAAVPLQRAATTSETSVGRSGPRPHRSPQPMQDVLRDGPRRLTVADAQARPAADASASQPSAASQPERSAVVEPAARLGASPDESSGAPVPKADDKVAPRRRRRWLGLAIVTTATLTFVGSWFAVPIVQQWMGRVLSPEAAAWVGVPSPTNAVAVAEVAESADAIAAATECAAPTPSTADAPVATVAVTGEPSNVALADAGPIADVSAPAVDATATTAITPVAAAVVPTIEPVVGPTVATPAPAPTEAPPAVVAPVAAPTIAPAESVAAPPVAPAPRAKAHGRKSKSSKRSHASVASSTAAPVAARPPTTNGPDALALLREAEKAFADGRHGTALRNAQRSEAIGHDARATRIIALSACKLGRTAVAEAAIGRLPVGQRRGVRSTCRFSE